MTGSKRFWTRHTNKPCCALNAKLSTPRARAASRWPFRKAKPCWSGPSPKENRPPGKPHNSSACCICTAWLLCAAPFGKLSNGIRRVPPRSPSCCVGTIAPYPCRRWISAVIRRRRRWMSAPTIWRLTMNSPTRATTTTPSNSLPAQLEQIGLHALGTEVNDFLARAIKQRWSPRPILEHLVQTEAAERAHRSLERRLRLSEIKKFKPMADFDWSWPTKIEREVIERALTLDFLPEARNLILVGTNGLGKTMIAQNICHGAVLAGHSVLFRSAAALLEELHRQTPEGRHRKLRTYANVGLLCVDEVGYLGERVRCLTTADLLGGNSALESPGIRIPQPRRGPLSSDEIE